MNSIRDGVEVRMLAADYSVREHADLFANHLELAATMRRLSQEMGTAIVGLAPGNEDDFLLGYTRALRDIADHLSGGDALPGGPLAAPRAIDRPVDQPA